MVVVVLAGMGAAVLTADQDGSGEDHHVITG
jgi:hypothetical protein